MHFHILNGRQRVMDSCENLENAGESSKKFYVVRALTQFLQQRVRQDDRAVILESLLATFDAQHAPTHPQIQVKYYFEIQH